MGYTDKIDFELNVINLDKMKEARDMAAGIVAMSNDMLKSSNDKESDLFGLLSSDMVSHLQDITNMATQAGTSLQGLMNIAKNSGNQVGNEYHVLFTGITQELNSLSTYVDVLQRKYDRYSSKVEKKLEEDPTYKFKQLQVRQSDDKSILRLAGLNRYATQINKMNSNHARVEMTNDIYSQLAPIIEREAHIVQNGRDYGRDSMTLAHTIASNAGIQNIIKQAYRKKPNDEMTPEFFQDIVESVIIGRGLITDSYNLRGLKYKGSPLSVHRYTYDNIPEIFKQAVADRGLSANAHSVAGEADSNVIRNLVRYINKSNDYSIQQIASRRGILSYGVNGLNNTDSHAIKAPMDAINLFAADIAEYINSLRAGAPTYARDPATTLAHNDRIQRAIDVANILSKQNGLSPFKNDTFSTISEESASIFEYNNNKAKAKIRGTHPVYIIPKTHLNENLELVAS